MVVHPVEYPWLEYSRRRRQFQPVAVSLSGRAVSFQAFEKRERGHKITSSSSASLVPLAELVTEVTKQGSFSNCP